MILTFLISSLVTAINSIFFLLPTVSLPEGVSNFLSNGVAYYRMFSDFFPPGGFFLELMLWYFTFKIGMIIAKFFLGARLPTLT